MSKNYQFLLLLTEEQQQTIHFFAGASRYVFNKGLLFIEETKQQTDQPFDYCLLNPWLQKQLESAETPWLTSVPFVLLQDSIDGLIEAHKASQKQGGEAVGFRKKGRSDIFCFESGIKLNSSKAKVLVPIIGWMNFVKKEEISGQLQKVTLKKRGRHWFVDLTTSDD